MAHRLKKEHLIKVYNIQKERHWVLKWNLRKIHWNVWVSCPTLANGPKLIQKIQCAVYLIRIEYKIELLKDKIINLYDVQNNYRFKIVSAFSITPASSIFIKFIGNSKLRQIEIKKQQEVISPKTFFPSK